MEGNLKKITTLADLKIGQVSRVVKINTTNKQIKRHLLDMGITKGVEIEIKKVAPMGDPIDIKLRGYELCLRRKDLEEIEVEVII